MEYKYPIGTLFINTRYSESGNPYVAWAKVVSIENELCGLLIVI